MTKNHLLDNNFKYFGFWTFSLTDEEWEIFSRNCPLPPDYAFFKKSKECRKTILLLWKSYERLDNVWGRVDYRCATWMTSNEVTIPPLHILFDYFSQLKCLRHSQPTLISLVPSSLNHHCDIAPINLDIFRYHTSSQVGVVVYKLEELDLALIFPDADYCVLKQFPYEKNGLFRQYCIDSYLRHHRMMEMMQDQESFDMWYPLYCADCEKAWFWRKFFTDSPEMIKLAAQVEEFETNNEMVQMANMEDTINLKRKVHSMGL